MPAEKGAPEALKGKSKGKERAQESGSGDRDVALEEWKTRMKGLLCDLVDTIAEKP